MAKPDFDGFGKRCIAILFHMDFNTETKGENGCGSYLQKMDIFC